MAKASLLLKLSIQQDERTVEQTEIKGRISYFFRTFSDKFSEAFKANLLYVGIFALPLLFVMLVLPKMLESLVMTGKTFVGNIGIGYPGTVDNINEALLEKYNYFRTILIPCALPAIFVAVFGMSGIFHISRGFMWKEKVIVHKAFFRGIKQLWRPFLITGIIVTGIAAGIMYGMVWHFELLSQNSATAASWILFVALLIVGILTACILIFLLPTFACYRLSFLKSLKNALILFVSLIPTTLFISIFTIGILLLSKINTIFSVIVGIGLLSLGFLFFSCMWTGYSQYAFDSFIVPQYNSMVKAADVSKKKKQNKKVNPYKTSVASTAKTVKKYKNK